MPNIGSKILGVRSTGSLLGTHGVLTPDDTGSFLIDNLSVTPDFLWSVHQVNGLVTNCIRIRRTSDNAEQNIGFDENGYIDTAGIATFIGGGSGYVVTFFNGAGDGNNGTETTTTDQCLYGATSGVDGQAGMTSPTTNNQAYALDSNITAYTESESYLGFTTGTTASTARYFNTIANRGYIELTATAELRIHPTADIGSSGLIVNNSSDHLLRVNWDGSNADFYDNATTATTAYST